MRSTIAQPQSVVRFRNYVKALDVGAAMITESEVNSEDECVVGGGGDDRRGGDGETDGLVAGKDTGSAFQGLGELMHDILEAGCFDGVWQL